MTGDCGHGWKYHLHGASGPCYKCEEKENEISNYLIDLVKNHPASMHSPHYTNPCSKTCKVCNMDKELYDIVRAKINREKTKCQTQ